MQPPVYVINLDTSLDRLLKSKERLEEQSITSERISGVLGSALTQEELKKHYCPNLNREKYHTALTPSQIGCYLSHRKAWERTANGEAPYAIVLEDDIKLIGNLTNAIQTIESFNFPWDLIKLSAYQSRLRKIKFSRLVANDMNLVIHNKPMSGGAATAISKSAAKRLLAATEKFGRPVDTDIQHFWEKNIEVVSLMPYPIAQDMKFDSMIAAKKVNRKKYFWKKKWQQLLDGITNYREVRKQIKKLQKLLKN
nr:glycosyltransferase family 25 protein [Candidatus Thioglobus sp.]